MSLSIKIHPINPEPRLIRRVVEVLQQGGIIVYPTDSCYAFGCHLGNKGALERIRRLRGVSNKHNFTLVCRDLAEIATYAKVDNSAYRLLKANTPGPYTFILPATHEVPRRLQHPKRKSIGIRVPDHPIARSLLAALEQPLMSSTLILLGDITPLTEPAEIQERLEQEVDLIIDGGNCGFEPTTVVDLVSGVPRVTRLGRGEVTQFG